MSAETPDPALLIIDDARPDDVDAIMEIERVSFGAAWQADQYLEAVTRQETHCFLMARVADRAVGTAWLVLAGERAYLATLGVLPDYRRAGIGTALVEALLARAVAAGHRQVVLEVRSRNVAAQQLYAAVGFTAIGNRRGLYDNPPDDGAVMIWQAEEEPPSAW